MDDNFQDENEYQRAANILTKHIEESGLELPSNDDAVEQCRADFMERYSPEKLAALSDEEILQYIFYSDGDNSESLCYWIERNPQCREFFGSISGGSAYKFGLFKKKILVSGHLEVPIIQRNCLMKKHYSWENRFVMLW